MTDTFDPATVSWVMEPSDLEFLLAAVETCSQVCIDLETTGLNEHAPDARIVLASLTLPQPDDADPERPTTWVLPLHHPDSPWLGSWRSTLGRVAQVVLRERKAVWNQNMKFDARWINAHTGVDLSHLIEWDTQISSHLLDENSSSKLKERVPATFEVERWDDFDLSENAAAERIPLFDLGLYAARDTYWMWRLARYHQLFMYVGSEDYPVSSEEIGHARLGRLMTWCAMPTVRTLTSIEQRGILTDPDWIRKAIDERAQALARVTDELVGRYAETMAERGYFEDTCSFAPTSHWFREWADIAVESGDLIVAELTPTGKPRWSKGVLQRQARGSSQVAADLLELRGLTKKLEYLRSWLTLAGPDNRIHASYNVGSVVTGRLSSSTPNMQQVTAALKPAFVPSPGFVFVDLDYSQIELRVAAHISKCPRMTEAFLRDEDLHTRLAARITGKDESEVSATERQAGKSANFGLLYGMGVYGFKMYAEDVYGVIFTSDEAALAHATFFETWEGIGPWHARVERNLYQSGEVYSPIGRVRRLPGVWDSNPEVSSAAVRAAINSPVQGFASDIMQIAAASISGNLPGVPAVHGARIVATVHDQILAEVPEDRAQEVAQECRQRMVDVPEILRRRFECDFIVPLKVDAKLGTRWGLSDLGTLT